MNRPLVLNGFLTLFSIEPRGLFASYSIMRCYRCRIYVDVHGGKAREPKVHDGTSRFRTVSGRHGCVRDDARGGKAREPKVHDGTSRFP